MSTVLSKRLDIFSNYSLAKEYNIYPKDKFERFGDDLSEVLLSYLSLEDRFRFECVSKQFQRLVFNKVESFNVNHRRLCSNVLLAPFDYRKRVDIKALQTVLKKCKNIRKLYSEDDVINEEDVFNTIIENCSQLHEIVSDLENLSDETIDKFCAKFGPKLRRINFIPNNLTVKKMLRSCPNLEIMGYYWINLKDFFDGNKLLLQNIKSFSFYYFSEDIQRMSTFVGSNRNTLKALEMIVYDKTLTTIQTKALFNELSNLTQLRSLGIYYYVSTDTSFVDFVRHLSDKCPNLSKIDFDLRINNSSDILKVYKSFNRYKQLKSIVFKNHCEDIPLIPIVSQSLKDCNHLQHLKIIGNTFKTTDEFFISIDKHFPKLLSLFLSNAQISGKAFNCLTKMCELRSISLISLSLESLITESEVFEFIENSLKVRSIYLINSGFSCDFSEREIESIKYFSNSAIHEICDSFSDNNSISEDNLQFCGEETNSDSDLI